MCYQTALACFLITFTCCAALITRDGAPEINGHGRPSNVVLILADQHRWDWTSFDIPALKTPAFADVAENGVRFKYATVPSPLCGPCRAALATGMYYENAGVPDNGIILPEHMRRQTVYRKMRDAGVHTMTTGKDDLTMNAYGSDGSNKAEELGFSAWHRCHGKFGHTMDPYGSDLLKQNSSRPAGSKFCPNGGVYACPVPQRIPQNLYQDDWIARKAIDLLQQAPKNKSFFLQVNYAGPHPPFILTQEMNASIDKSVKYPRAVKSNIPSQIEQLLRSEYAAEIENIDRLNGQIIETLADLQVLNDTVVCITADHGDQLGDFSGSGHGGNTWMGWHGHLGPQDRGFGKGQPWRGSTDVPLACMGPGIASGVVVQEPVSTLDLVASFLEIMHIDSSGLNSKPLRIIAPLSRHDNAAYRPATSAFGGPNQRAMFGVVQKMFPKFGRVYKLICCYGRCPYSEKNTGDWRGWEIRLFDLTRDPYEVHNIFSRETYDISMELVQTIPRTPGACGLAIRQQTGHLE